MNKNKIIKFAEKIIPFNRSLVGKDILKTLKIIQKQNNSLKIIKIPTSKKIYDWKVPKEWSAKSATIIDKQKKTIIDFKVNNLHLMSHSIPVNKFIKFKDLKKRLHYLKQIPNAIPYRTSYYKKDWGFCLSYNQFKKLKDDVYKVNINSKLKSGYLRYGEIFLKGKSKKEILFTTNICHPALANNETSGMVILTFLANYLKKKKLNYSYRLIFIPETIGALGYIKKNFQKLKKNILFGFICVCVGDNRNYSILESKFLDSNANFFAFETLNKLKIKFKKYSWLDRGSDERQFSSPNVEIDCASLMRSKYGEYREYHTSLDKLNDVVTSKGLKQSLKMYELLTNLIEQEKFPKSNFFGEPFLSKRKIYPEVGGAILPKKFQDLKNYLSFCDGKTPTKKINLKCKLNKKQGKNILRILIKNNLIKL
tara:strand:- start:3915 stop:5186 length:1272 start_codon:yes stop_codon:yes gene_type:complete